MTQVHEKIISDKQDELSTVSLDLEETKKNFEKKTKEVELLQT